MSITWLLPDPANPRALLSRPDLAQGRRRSADVLLLHTPDGGDIQLLNGALVMADGLYNALYLSMWGGNEQDSGLAADDAVQWWGNLTERDQARKYRSQTQHLLHSLPAIPANLRRVEAAARADTAWLVGPYVDAITPSASMPRLNTVTLTLLVSIADNTYGFNATEAWSKAA